MKKYKEIKFVLNETNVKIYRDQVEKAFAKMQPHFNSHQFGTEFRKLVPEYKNNVIICKEFLQKRCKKVSRFRYIKNGAPLMFSGLVEYDPKSPQKTIDISAISLDNAIKRIKMESDYVIYKITKQEI